ncbi:iron complex transport system ATP-binding protein [Paenibacillus sophorae]|nr:ABC transporter ATP-binding protein [Paenibacillus sophorae]SEO03055.1 iron complex transport system ATP-binding protein [Paenibacillus sophorae]
MLEVENLSCGYGSQPIVKEVSFSVRSGEIMCLLGPNGAGKTTLFKTLLSFLKPLGGTVKIKGQSTEGWSRQMLARAVGYVPQAHGAPFPFSVFDVVTMGRTAHLGLFAAPSSKDRSIADQALQMLQITALRDRIYTELSGGERQMVLIARALAQQPDILIMDEPTSNLDFGNQIRMLEQIRLLSNRGMTVVMTSHFPDHAFLCSDRVALLRRGLPFLAGSVKEVVTSENLKSAYGIDVEIAELTAATGQNVKTCVPLMRTESQMLEELS